MDQKRLFLAIAISIVILLVFETLMPHPAVHRPPPPQPAATAPKPPPAPGVAASAAAAPAAEAATAAASKTVPRVEISALRVEGSVSLVGARIDDVVLRDFHETVDKSSPLVRLLEPRSTAKPYYVQFGWTAAGSSTAKVPGNDTLWTSSGGTLTESHPVTLSWNNGAGLTFEITLSIDNNYMFHVQQRVVNNTGAAVSLYPWARVRRDYTPQTSGYYLLHEGLIGVVNHRLEEMTYKKAKSEGEKTGGLSYQADDQGGWAGITDKYWLAAVVPDQASPVVISFHHLVEDGTDRYQVDYADRDPEHVAPGATASTTSMMFAGAKEVHLLDHYESEYHIPLFSYAVDFGWFWFLTKPIFYALDWLNTLLGNFGLAIMAFTLGVKLLFFPLANKSYRSMSKMKLLGPKMTALRERYKDDPAKLQSEMMGLYKAEKVNPASGCLPMVIQIPVFFSLYKDLYVTIEMRHAPFFGWIHDLSAIDPTNVFTLFGLIPWDPMHISPLLHLGAWPLIMGFTMYFQQRLNPPPPDPTQAKLFQFMPVIFTFMLARFPAGLVIYWSWNNLLTIGQQWLIMRQTRLTSPRLVRASTRRT
ncbi:MAG TPA: membrane protein insertase YidC [Acetobacteraceae bacterium]|nr:membrane protein insertase YidC [Acetobacteraceae bacterium]